jgi:hypothetical protein
MFRVSYRIKLETTFIPLSIVDRYSYSLLKLAKLASIEEKIVY